MRDQLLGQLGSYTRYIYITEIEIRSFKLVKTLINDWAFNQWYELVKDHDLLQLLEEAHHERENQGDATGVLLDYIEEHHG